MSLVAPTAPNAVDERWRGEPAAVVPPAISRRAWGWLLPLLMFAWALRLLSIAPLELGTDGGLAVGLAVGPIHDIFDFNARDVHPPLYYLLLRAWIDQAGLSWVALKWLSASAGALSVAALARWLRGSIGAAPAIVGAGALAIAPSAVIAGATVRDFACGLAATLLANLAFWLLVQQSSRRAAVTLAATTAAAGWLWYFHLPVFVAQVSLALFWRPARRCRVPLLIGAAAWLPWAVFAAPPLLHKIVDQVGSFGSGHGSGVRPLAEVFAVATGWYPGVVPPQLPAAAIIGAAAVGAWRGWRRQGAVFTLYWVAAAVLGGALLWYVNGHWDPQAGIDRYGLIVVPFLIAGTVAAGRRPAALATIVLLWVALTAPALVRMPHAASARPAPPDPALALVLSRWQPGDAATFESIDRLGYFAVRGGDPASAFAAEDNGSAFRQAGDAARIAKALPPLEARHNRVWYISDGNKPGTRLQHALDTSATLTADWKTPSGEVRLYTTGRT